MAKVQVNMHEAKTKLSQLAERVWAGDQVIIAKAGKPYLNLSPYKQVGALRELGGYHIEMADDFDVTPSEVIDEFEQ
jgi:prevent-host-death family protein